MDSHSKNYCQNVTQQPCQNRETLLLVLVSKLALVLLLCLIYTGIRYLN
jgi:hypothetical protein